MKATLRKNGLMMVTLRVRFDFAREHFIQVVANELRWGNDLPTSRAGLIKLMKTLANTNGCYLIFDNRSEEDMGWTKEENAKAQEKAEALVDKLFPELKGKT